MAMEQKITIEVDICQDNTNLCNPQMEKGEITFLKFDPIANNINLIIGKQETCIDKKLLIKILEFLAAD